MIKVSSVEFERNPAHYEDAVQTGPITITREGRDLAVLLSIDDFDRLRRVRQVLTLGDFSEAEIVALEAVRAPESSKAFDEEVS